MHVHASILTCIRAYHASQCNAHIYCNAHTHVLVSALALVVRRLPAPHTRRSPRLQAAWWTLLLWTTFCCRPVTECGGGFRIGSNGLGRGTGRWGGITSPPGQPPWRPCGGSSQTRGGPSSWTAPPHLPVLAARAATRGARPPPRRSMPPCAHALLRQLLLTSCAPLPGRTWGPTTAGPARTSWRGLASRSRRPWVGRRPFLRPFPEELPRRVALRSAFPKPSPFV